MSEKEAHRISKIDKIDLAFVIPFLTGVFPGFYKWDTDTLIKLSKEKIQKSLNYCSKIVKNLKQIKELVSDTQAIAKARMDFLIEDLEKERQYRSNQGRSDRQVENNYKILFWSVLGLVVTFLVSLFFPWV